MNSHSSSLILLVVVPKVWERRVTTIQAWIVNSYCIRRAGKIKKTYYIIFVYIIFFYYFIFIDKKFLQTIIRNSQIVGLVEKSIPHVEVEKSDNSHRSWDPLSTKFLLVLSHFFKYIHIPFHLNFSYNIFDFAIFFFTFFNRLNII